MSPVFKGQAFQGAGQSFKAFGLLDLKRP